jgi:hypothetical protein
MKMVLRNFKKSSYNFFIKLDNEDLSPFLTKSVAIFKA